MFAALGYCSTRVIERGVTATGIHFVTVMYGNGERHRFVDFEQLRQFATGDVPRRYRPATAEPPRPLLASYRRRRVVQRQDAPE